MIKTFGKFTMAGILAAVMLGAVSQLSAADTNTPAAPAPAPAHAKPKIFRGTLADVNNTDKTITVDNKTEKSRVFLITSDTKIMKDGKPATLGDGVKGEPVGGTYSTNSDGKMVAKTVRFGAPKRPAPAPAN